MNPMVKLAASAQSGEKKYVLFAGAGISKDAGVPSAWDLMLKTASLLYAADNLELKQNVNIEEWFISSDYAKMGYAELIEKLYPCYPDQQSFLKQYLESYSAGESHKGIAELARRGIIRAIVTTNFDQYLERALEEKGLEVQVISTDEDLRNTEPLIHCKSIRIYKPHGDLGKGALKNTPKDLEELSPLMETELVKVLSEHGVIIMGYSGYDLGIQKVFEHRNRNFYPVFWINPTEPSARMSEILKIQDFTYIPCNSASQFIEDYFMLIVRLESLAPRVEDKPSISDLRFAFSSQREPMVPLYEEFLFKTLRNMEFIKPDFTKFPDRDEAIVDQLHKGIPIVYDFIEASLLAARYGQLDILNIIYDSFGNLHKFHSLPEGSSDSYYQTDFDGYKFLVFEMFVTFIASLIKFNKWNHLEEILSKDLFIERIHESKYVDFTSLSKHIASLDEHRNSRMNLRRTSVMADFIKERFTQSNLKNLFSHKEFLESDYFLFLRTICLAESTEYLGNVWCPRSCIFLDHTPVYISKSMSNRFLKIVSQASGFGENVGTFVERIKQRHDSFNRFFKQGGSVDSPLEFFDFEKLGSRE